MGRAERIVFALAAAGEAGQAALLAQRADAVPPPGQDLVRVGLVADVPDHLVHRRIEHGVQGDGEFDHAERGAEMAAGDGDGIHGFAAQFGGKLLKLLSREISHVRRDTDPIQQGGDGTAHTLCVHRMIDRVFLHTLSAPARNDPGRERAQPVRFFPE